MSKYPSTSLGIFGHVVFGLGLGLIRQSPKYSSSEAFSPAITSLSPHASLTINHSSTRTGLLYVGLFGRNIGS